MLDHHIEEFDRRMLGEEVQSDVVHAFDHFLAVNEVRLVASLQDATWSIPTSEGVIS